MGIKLRLLGYSPYGNEWEKEKRRESLLLDWVREGSGEVVEVGRRSWGGTGIEAIMYLCIIFCLSSSSHCEAVKRAFPDTAMPPPATNKPTTIKITSSNPYPLGNTKNYTFYIQKSFLCPSSQSHPFLLSPLHSRQKIKGTNSNN